MTRQELIQQIRQKRSFLCVGLDSDPKKMPQCVFDLFDPVYEFNKTIIDATAPYCVAYKPNLAFYEAYGIHGMTAFKKTVKYIKEKHPHHFIIADAKRGDIGNTSKMYARTFFEEYDVDALTVAPYMGEDSITPFLEYEGKWVAVLALTSNKGSQDFQMQEDKFGYRLFERVVNESQKWGTTENMMFVVGATQGELIKDVRKYAPDHFLLVPGVGAQGGSLKEVCQYGMTKDCGLLVNASRSIIYACDDDHYAEEAGNKARELQQQMAAELEKLKI
ncbi:MAG: orotidine-5'-phosphate decarboxylase [Prevotella sp.]|nr:orotidine-5'-phosphate decarboxylase [Prevotella sp.]